MSDPADNSTASDIGKAGAAEQASRTVCRQCLERLHLGDNFCRHCGGITEVGEALVKIGRLPAPVSAALPAKPPSSMEHPVVVLLALSLFGPLVLPMLWWSRRFTRGWKIGLTIAVLAVTVYACWYTVKLFNTAVDQMRQAGLL